MSKDVSKKIIDRIKQEHIHPDPAWKANWKSYLFWVILIFLILLSAAFFSLMILSVADFDFELMHQLKLGGYFRLLMISAPYLWIVMLAVTIALGYHVFRKTKKGYRYSVLFIAGIIFLLVSALGVAAHIGKVNKRFDETFARGPAPLHRLAPPPGEEKFFMPEEGVVAGKIIEKNNSFFVIDASENGEWEVSYDENTKVRKKEFVEEGKDVIVFGEKTEELKFKAFGIKPMRGPKRNLDEKEKEEGRPHLPGEGRARGRGMVR